MIRGKNGGGITESEEEECHWKSPTPKPLGLEKAVGNHSLSIGGESVHRQSRLRGRQRGSKNSVAIITAMNTNVAGIRLDNQLAQQSKQKGYRNPVQIEQGIRGGKPRNGNEQAHQRRKKSSRRGAGHRGH